MEMTTDEKYMRRCLQLARNGCYGAAPNPMVGAVLVCDGKVVGEGYHARCGEAHAEVNAIRSVGDESLLRRCTLYVSLEPCAHYGKTPPCADLIVAKGIPRVVVGCGDPFARVAGRGIRKLREAGIEVTVGVLEAECVALNRRFMTFQADHRPYVTLKWAESADGFMDSARKAPEEPPYVFSTPFTQMLVHRLRARHQAIMVGTGTALADNPALTNRLWAGPSPLRVVADPHGRLPRTLRLFDGSRPTLAFIGREADPVPYEGLPGVTVVRVDFSCGGGLEEILARLHALSVQSLLVEGGRRLLESFMAGGWFDEVIVEQSPVCLRGGVRAPGKPGGRQTVESADGHTVCHIFPGGRMPLWERLRS